VSNDSIDASVGLAFSLKLFQHYRKSGILQAEMRYVPGVAGSCKAYLRLVDGDVIACYVDDKRKQRYQLSSDFLCTVDNKKGPFEWSFQPLITQLSPAKSVSSPGLLLYPTPPPQASPALSSRSYPGLGLLSSPIQDWFVPTIISIIDWERLSIWTFEQKQMLYTVLKMIDGRRSVQEIKASVPLTPHLVDETLRILLALQVIIF